MRNRGCLHHAGYIAECDLCPRSAHLDSYDVGIAREQLENMGWKLTDEFGWLCSECSSSPEYQERMRKFRQDRSRT